MSARTNLQHVLDQILIVALTFCQVYGFGVDDKQRRVVVIIEKLRVGVIELLQIAELYRPFAGCPRSCTRSKSVSVGACR